MNVALERCRLSEDDPYGVVDVCLALSLSLEPPRTHSI